MIEKFGKTLDESNASVYYCDYQNELNTLPNMEKNRFEISKIEGNKTNNSQRFDMNSSKNSYINFPEKESNKKFSYSNLNRK